MRRRAWVIPFVAVLFGAQPVPAERGRILDRDGAVLAENRGRARVYPRGGLAAHIIGYLTPRGSGGAGVEKALDRELEGGEDVVLTVDRDVQKVAEKAVRAHEAAAVAVIEVETGRILALVSKPSFDPNDLASPGTLERLATEPLRPLIDRTLEKTYRPASTFKVVTAVAALENGLASPGEEMTCSGTRSVGQHVLRDMDVHGTLDLLDALQRSCNVYFWTLAERVGVDRLAAVARDFGFGARTGLGINGDVAGQIPDHRLYSGNADADLELTLNTAVGLGDVKVTVLQLAMAYAALANGGRLFVPQVVRRLQSASGEVIADRPPVLRRSLHASAPTVDIIRRGMTRAVNRRGGTAFTARKGAVKMVGKTGTFEAPDRPDPVETADAWFAGWAPQEHPRIAVVVLVERGGIGGAVAAPVARAIIDGYFTRVGKPVKKAQAPKDKKKRAAAAAKANDRKKKKTAAAKKKSTKKPAARKKAKKG